MPAAINRSAARRITPALVLMLLMAASLAIVSALHLTGAVGGGAQGGAHAAGIAEAIICVALLAGAWALVDRPNGRALARAGVLFAIAGFILGLTITLQGGDTFDVVYHLTGLAVLLVIFAVLWPHPAPLAEVTGPVA